MTLDEMKTLEAKYQSMCDAITAGESVSYILGSDWGFGLPCTDKKGPAIKRATEIFCRKYGDVTQFVGHARRG